MKAINNIFLFFLFIHTSAFAQPELSIYEQFIQSKTDAFKQSIVYENDSFYANDSSYQIYFYHLKLKPSLDSNYLEGKIKYKAKSIENDLHSIKIDLAEEFQIHSFNGLKSIVRDGRILILELEESLESNTHFQFEIEYKGKPALLNNIKGLVYKFENADQPLIASLSTPYLGHQWWPCQDGPQFKADSVYIDISIPERYVGNRLITGVSNGLLESTHFENDTVTFEWRHRYPIVPYYIMVAISNYELIEDQYTSPEFTSFPLEYFVFPSHLDAATEGVYPMPWVMEFFEEKFGPYPFANEKYGMTQLGFYGGIENQTNSIMNRMSTDYFMVSVHELAHMWFGDKLTCQDWHEAWLNEGFASYAECLWIEHMDGQTAYQSYLNNKKYFGPGSLYLESDNDPFKIFVTIIYHKGAWFLHMLRRLIGDDSFFTTIIDYANHPDLAYGHVRTTHLKQIAETVSNQDLDWFFDQWIYGERHPFYLYNFDQNDEGNLEVFIQQDQYDKYGSETIFHMPLEIKFNFEDGSSSIHKLSNNKAYQSYELDFTKVVQSIELDPNQSILCEKQYDIKLSLSDEIAKEEFIIIPNPCKRSDKIHIKTKEFIQKIEILDIQGKSLWTKHFHNSDNFDATHFVLPPSIYPGNYFISLYTRNSKLTQKITVIP